MDNQVNDELSFAAERLFHERDRLRELVDQGRRQLQDGEFMDYNSQSLRARFDQLKDGKHFEPQQNS